jgi:hypothetical protein
MKYLILALSILLVSCSETKEYDKTFRDVIVGEYLISDYNETIEFDEDGMFYINDIVGDYEVNPNNFNEIYCIYDTTVDTMKLVGYIGSFKTLRVRNIPTHTGELLIMTNKKYIE